MKSREIPIFQKVNTWFVKKKISNHFGLFPVPPYSQKLHRRNKAVPRVAKSFAYPPPLSPVFKISIFKFEIWNVNQLFLLEEALVDCLFEFLDRDNNGSLTYLELQIITFDILIFCDKESQPHQSEFWTWLLNDALSFGLFISKSSLNKYLSANVVRNWFTPLVAGRFFWGKMVLKIDKICTFGSYSFHWDAEEGANGTSVFLKDFKIYIFWGDKNIRIQF